MKGKYYDIKMSFCSPYYRDIILHSFDEINTYCITCRFFDVNYIFPEKYPKIKYSPVPKVIYFYYEYSIAHSQKIAIHFLQFIYFLSER
jgi:hypothetical protein